MRTCKACNLPGAPASFREIEAMMESSPVFKREPLADPSLYLNRVEACLACAYLIDGTTCHWCGCLVPLRARLLSGTCPAPGEDRWNTMK